MTGLAGEGLMIDRRGLLAGGAAALAIPVQAAAGATGARIARPARGPAPPPWLAGLDEWVEARRIDWKVPGAAVCVVQGSEVVWSRGFGTTIAGGSSAVTADTVFRVASSTKQIGAGSVAAVVGQGQAAWDAPVSAILPGFRTRGGEEYGSISLRDMLSHRTGLPRHDLVWYGSSGLATGDLLERLPHLALTAPLRARYQYNNIMVALAGLAAARAAGLPDWETLARQALFDPLGMTRTSTSVAAMQALGNHATGHAIPPGREAVPVTLRMDGALGAAGAVNSSVLDYARWAAMQLQRGRWAGRVIVPEQAVMAQREPAIMAGGPGGEHIGRAFYGLGWRLDSYRGLERVHHAGDLNGFTSRVTLLPQRELALIAFVNAGSSPFPNAVVMDLTDRILGLAPLDWSGQALARRTAAETAPPEPAGHRDGGTTPSRPLPAFAGTFADPGYGQLAVHQGAGGLTARFNDMEARLEHWHHDVFLTAGVPLHHGDFGGLRLSFLPDPDGSIASVEVLMDDDAPPIRFRRA